MRGLVRLTIEKVALQYDRLLHHSVYDRGGKFVRQKAVKLARELYVLTFVPHDQLVRSAQSVQYTLGLDPVNSRKGGGKEYTFNDCEREEASGERMRSNVEPFEAPSSLVPHGREGIDRVKQLTELILVHNDFLYDTRVSLGVDVSPAITSMSKAKQNTNVQTNIIS